MTMSLGAPRQPVGPPNRRRRRTDRLTSTWLVIAVALGAFGLMTKSVLPQPLWSMVHVVTLGVLTNAILQWSWYFTRTLLRLPEDDARAGRDAVIRSAVFNLALVALFAAMWTGNAVAASVFATVIGIVIAWHAAAILSAARTRFASRFAVVIRFYVVAAAYLVVGCALAGLISVAMFDPAAPAWLVDYRDRLTLAHSIVNIGGWIGLSIAGTIVTLGPTMLRTRIIPDAVPRAVAALPWLAGGIAVAATSAAVGWLPGVGVGLLVFAVAVVPGVAVALVRTAVAKSPSTYATWTMASGLAWVVVAVTAIAVDSFVAPDAAALRTSDLPWVAVLGIGGIGQVFIGALTYLLPVVVGGGPRSVRAGMAVLEIAWPLRVAVRNTAMTLIAVTAVVPSDLTAWWWALVIVTFAIDTVLFAVGGVKQVRARRAEPPAGSPPSPVPPPTAGGTRA